MPKTQSEKCVIQQQLLQEWDKEKNKDNISIIYKMSHKKYWWLCALGHSYNDSIAHKYYGRGCPYCSGKKILIGFNDLTTTHPELCQEWDYARNTVQPTEISRGSNIKIWWTCKVGHNYSASVHNRAMCNSGCPYCSNRKVLSGVNDLQTKYPNIAKEWDYDKNAITPNLVLSQSNTKFWWICPCQHSYLARVDDRSNHHSGCPYCYGRLSILGETDLLTKFPDLCQEWSKKNKYPPSHYTYGSKKSVWWICHRCGFEWTSSICNRTNHKNRTGCPKCRMSKGELEIIRLLKIYNITYIHQKRFKQCIHKQQLPFDFYLPDLNICIEYQGEQHYHPLDFATYSHTNQAAQQRFKVMQQRDAIKKQFCHDNNIHLITIPYWDYNNINNIIQTLRNIPQ